MSNTATLLEIAARPLTASAFQPFGDVIEADGDPTMIINQGRCGRFHDLARLSFDGGDAGISIFKYTTSAMPYERTLMERHPIGSQAFLPLSGAPYLVVVAPDADGRPEQPQAFLARADQGINYLKNTWHAPLIALEDNAVFAVIDRIGVGENLQEIEMETPYVVSLPATV